MSFDKQHVMGADGYRDAFYELAALMDIGARPQSPQEVWQAEMLPRLKAALEASSRQEERLREQDEREFWDDDEVKRGERDRQKVAEMSVEDMRSGLIAALLYGRMAWHSLELLRHDPRPDVGPYCRSAYNNITVYQETIRENWYV